MSERRKYILDIVERVSGMQTSSFVFLSERRQQSNLYSFMAQALEYIEKKENLYIMLRTQISSAGLLEKKPFYYWSVGLLILGMLGLSFYFLVTLHNPVLKFLNVFLLALVTVQGGLWGHDLAHHQIFKSQRLYSIIGIVWWNLLLGGSFGYWNQKHSRHHAHPNTIDRDGDIYFPTLWFSPMLARGINTLQRKILPYQKNYFLPLLIFPHVVQIKNSISYLARQKTITAAAEAILFFLHHAVVWYFFLAFSPFPQSLYLLVVYHVFVGIYLGIIFSPNHYGMPILPTKNDLDYLHEQLSTTRNITPGIFNDILYGGLNYQIEHHLFPTMPRKNLKIARELVKKFCRENAISYHETGTIQAFREILRQLREVSHLSVATHIISNL